MQGIEFFVAILKMIVEDKNSGKENSAPAGFLVFVINMASNLSWPV